MVNLKIELGQLLGPELHVRLASVGRASLRESSAIRVSVAHVLRLLLTRLMTIVFDINARDLSRLLKLLVDVG